MNKSEIIFKEYSNGMKIHEIIKKYDLYKESEFNGHFKKMNKSEIEDYFGIKFSKIFKNTCYNKNVKS